MLTLSVIGTGYLGATHAAGMAELGFTVVGLDTDAAKIASLADGRLPFYEPGLPELLKANLDSGRLRFTTDFMQLADADVHFICVGTPQMKESNAANLAYVFAAAKAIAEVAKDGSLIVGKSTVPVGTAERLLAEINRINPTLGLAWNPEFLREGFAVEDTLRPNRMVVGVADDAAEATLKQVYAKLIAEQIPWIRSDLRTAELVKTAANAFLSTKISFINAMAEVCDAAGADVTTLAAAIGHDPRIGNRFLQAGIGFGGGCLSKDLRGFMARAEELGATEALDFLSDIDAINLRARNRMIEFAVMELEGNPVGKKIFVMGAAFKPDSDDVRDSPALVIADALSKRGAQIVIHDPEAIENAKLRYPHLHFADTVAEAAAAADLVLHLTEWREYREIDPSELGRLVARRKIIDGRNALSATKWQEAGWTYLALGRPRFEAVDSN
ncbi:MAG TPA: UDP-glucose/GDP-mannose dehydrogenase family protein [Candidatus Nanopelagicaceae bacterium]|nr:UDP-glucose/GDP-mannose dehydrogenase family protein [Candidatus Nanopelagicaceae bacterium]